jgi:DNA-3-methyladenine glycosylase I
MPRCFGDGDPLYEEYHDTEWGIPVRGERELYERVSLEAFQSGLAWITILRKRPAFRAAFASFEPERVVRFTDDDVARLLADAGIVRNRAKIEATIANAHAVVGLWALGKTLSELFWSHVDPEPLRRRPLTWADVPSQTDGSRALAKALKAAGFRFDDHLAGCPRAVIAPAPGPGRAVVAPDQHPDGAVSPFGTNP